MTLHGSTSGHIFDNDFSVVRLVRTLIILNSIRGVNNVLYDS